MLGLFKGKRTSEPSPPQARIKAITQREAPREYVSVGRSTRPRVRRQVFKQAVVRLQHGEQLPVIIRNLSAGGCRLEYSRLVIPVGRVRLIEPSLPINLWADIAWRTDGACGLRFERRAGPQTAPQTATHTPQSA